MEQEDDEISLVDILVVLLKHRTMIIMVALAALLFSAGYVLLKPDRKNAVTVETYATITVNPLVKQFTGSLNMEETIIMFYVQNIDLLYSAILEAGITNINGFTLSDNPDKAKFVIKKLFIEGKKPDNSALKDAEKPFVVVNTNGVISVSVFLQDKETSKRFLESILKIINNRISSFILPVAEKEVADYERLSLEGSKSSSNLLENSLAIRYPVYSSAQSFVKGDKTPLIISPVTVVESTEAGSSRLYTIMVIGFFGGLFFAVFIAFILEAIENIKKDPEAMAKINNALRRSHS